jgi:hypothetical protein
MTARWRERSCDRPHSGMGRLASSLYAGLGRPGGCMRNSDRHDKVWPLRCAGRSYNSSRRDASALCAGLAIGLTRLLDPQTVRIPVQINRLVKAYGIAVSFRDSQFLGLGSRGARMRRQKATQRCCHPRSPPQRSLFLLRRLACVSKKRMIMAAMSLPAGQGIRLEQQRSRGRAQDIHRRH